MGLTMEMGFRVRKFVVVSIRTCYRSVRNYPFLFGLLCFLILLYRSCPFLFSLLVSASPVLICTAVLLGTLLSFGQPNIPEIETEEKLSRDVASLRSGILDNATVVAKEDDSFTVQRFEGNEVENSYVERGSEEERKTSKLDELAGFVDFVPVIHERSCEIQFEKGDVKEFEKVGIQEFEKGGVEEFEKGEVEKAAAVKEFHNSELEEGREIYGRDLDVRSLATDDQNAVENQLLAAQSMRDEILEVEDHNISIEPVHKGDQLNLSLNDKDDHDENDYDSSGSESDRAESSSPDASMADIIPLLDELHPLLDSETPLPVNRSNEESDASSEQSHKSDGECVMSDDEAENQGEEGGVVEPDEDDDDDDDEGMQEEKEDESKSAIKWTEDDQKNLMDLGSLELERNQRLENLIARRRARNNLRMLAGKNLIDLEGFDLPANVPPISTARRNPFDLPYDSYSNMGLPPIPGSAPSILLPRRNPFDLPYDPNEEKPDLKSDDFEQEFLLPQQKDMFRRHESFSVGPSNFAVPKQEQQNIRWKPYFMPEKIAAEGTSYSPLERQFSEISESKLSSVSDTESMSSIADQDDKKPDESQSFLETTAVSYLDPTASGIEHGNGPWEDIGSEDYVQENRDVHHEVIEITLGSTESHFESQSGSSEIRAADIPVEINASEIHSKNALVETDFSSNSSLSSLSEEVHETPFEVKTDEVKPTSHQTEESGIDTTSISVSAALEEDADFKTASEEVLDDNQHREPVYDSSPSAEGKESEVHSEIEQDVTSSLKAMHDASSELYIVDKNEQESREGSEVIVHEVTMVESPKHDTNYDAQYLSVAPELLVEHVSIDSGLSFSNIVPMEKGIVGDVKEDKDRLTSHEEDIIDGVNKIEDENLDSSPSSDRISSRSLTFTEPEDQLPSAQNHVSADIGSPSYAKYVEMHETLNNEENAELEQPKICRSSSLGSNSVEEVILQTDTICHSDQPTTSISNLGSEIPAQNVHDLVGMTDSVATSHDHLTTTNATIPGSQEQKCPPVMEEQVELISLSSTFPSKFEQVEERSMNEKVVRSEQDIVESSSIKSHTESEALQNLDIKIASSGSSTSNATPEVISSITELEQSWSDKPMVEPVLSNRVDAEEPGVLSTDSAAEVISENTAPKVHQDISTALSSVEHDSPSSSSDHDFSSPDTGRYPKDGIVDAVVFEDREEVSKHLDYLAEAYGSRFSEKTIREEIDEIADIDEGLLSELDEVGDFSIKEVGEPVLGKKVLPEEAQEERFELGSNSSSTEANSEIPILEARSLDDINLVYRQLHEGVDMEDVILPNAIVSQVNEDTKPETSSDLEVVEARSLGDIHVALSQASESNIGERGSSSNNSETKSDIPTLEAKSLDDINIAFRQLQEGVDVEDVILPSAVKSQVTDEAKPETSSDLEVVEARSLGDIHVALMQLSEDNIGESGSGNPTETKSDIPILEARSLDDINLAFRQLHEGVDVEDVILPSAIESQVKEAKDKTSSDLEVVEAKSLGDIHVALMQASEKNLNELPTISVSNDPSEVLEPAGVDSIIEIASSNTTDADKPADTVDEKSVDPNVSASKTKDKKAKSGKSESGSSSSSSSSDSD